VTWSAVRAADAKGATMKIWAMRTMVLGVVLVAATAVAQDKPSGKVTIASKSIAVGIGVSWGDGKLTYGGKDYPFTVSGLSVVDVGISKVTATGNVYNLKQVADFAGNYTAAEAGAAVGAGKGAVAMKNQNGVVMRLTSTATGVEFTLAPKGVEVKLK
jgi:hypothetical protein